MLALREVLVELADEMDVDETERCVEPGVPTLGAVGSGKRMRYPPADPVDSAGDGMGGRWTHGWGECAGYWGTGPASASA